VDAATDWSLNSVENAGSRNIELKEFTTMTDVYNLFTSPFVWLWFPAISFLGTTVFKRETYVDMCIAAGRACINDVGTREIAVADRRHARGIIAPYLVRKISCNLFSAKKSCTFSQQRLPCFIFAHFCSAALSQSLEFAPSPPAFSSNASSVPPPNCYCNIIPGTKRTKQWFSTGVRGTHVFREQQPGVPPCSGQKTC